jgi:hypothetical protein
MAAAAHDHHGGDDSPKTTALRHDVFPHRDERGPLCDPPPPSASLRMRKEVIIRSRYRTLIYGYVVPEHVLSRNGSCWVHAVGNKIGHIDPFHLEVGWTSLRNHIKV